jgi:hypothetical protein
MGHGKMGHKGHGGPGGGLIGGFAHADADNDGFVSEAEFNVMTDMAFSKMDRNGDDVLDAKDMPKPHGPRPGGQPKAPNNG